MGRIFDIMVLGLGANGSSALYHLSQSPGNVIGIDRLTPPHDFGSSHGQSRIIRQAYYENPVYVPFVKEAYRLWHAMETISGNKLFLKTGCMTLGREHASVITGSVTSAELFDIDYEFLNSHDLKKKFPAFAATAETVGILEKNAGILFPEECIKTYLYQAQKGGAQINNNETVLKIIPKKDGVEVITDKEKYTVGTIIISAGAWTGKLLPELNLPLSVERQVQYWFKNKNAQQQPHLLPENMPVYIWEYETDKMFYGFPDLGNGIKIAYHHAGERIEPNGLNQEVSPQEVAGMKQVINDHFVMEAIFHTSAVCMYTNTPDLNFIIDHHPEFKNVIIASPCSGHGFKFSSLTGKLLSNMAIGKTLDFDISPFKIGRFLL